MWTRRHLVASSLTYGTDDCAQTSLDSTHDPNTDNEGNDWLIFASLNIIRY